MHLQTATQVHMGGHYIAFVEAVCQVGPIVALQLPHLDKSLSVQSQ